MQKCNKFNVPIKRHVGDTVIVDKGASNHKTMKNLVAVELKNLE
jgi:hypothetical protein